MSHQDLVEQIIEDEARNLFSELCEGDGEHSEELDRALIEKRFRIVIAAVVSQTRQEIAREQERDGAALLPADPSAAVQTEPLPHVEALRYALVKVRAHTSYANPSIELLAGLLQSIERIADEALRVHDTARVHDAVNIVGSAPQPLSEASASPHRSAAQKSSSSSSSSRDLLARRDGQ